MGRRQKSRRGSSTIDRGGWNCNPRWGGLWFALIGGAFVVIGVWNLAHGVREVFFYRHAKGTVNAYRAPDKAAPEDLAGGQLKFTYPADGPILDGCYPPQGKNAGQREGILCRPHQVGDSLDVYFDPWNPATCTLEPRIEPFFLFAMFAMPFFVLGVLAFFGRERAAGTSFIVSYFILSAVGTFGLLLASERVSWSVIVCLGLPMTLLIPLVARRLERWTRGRVSGKGVRMLAATTREKRNRFVGLTMASIFWWGGVSIFLGHLIWSAAETISAKRNYLAAPGRIVANRLKVNSDSDGTTYLADIVYEYRVEDRQLQNDRVAFFQVGSTMAAAEAIRGQYPMGAEVTVYYNPADPACSVLDRNLPESFYFVALFLSIFVVCGLLIVRATVGAGRSLLRQR